MFLFGNGKRVNDVTARLAAVERERDALRQALDAAQGQIAGCERRIAELEAERRRSATVARAAAGFGDSFASVCTSLRALAAEMDERRRKAAASSAEALTQGRLRRFGVVP